MGPKVKCTACGKPRIVCCNDGHYPATKYGPRVQTDVLSQDKSEYHDTPYCRACCPEHSDKARCTCGSCPVHGRKGKS